MAVEYLTGYEGDAFASTGDARADLLSITPPRRAAGVATLPRAHRPVVRFRAEAPMMKTKADLVAWLDRNAAPFIELADAIWQTPEAAWHEFESSKLQADLLEKHGFRIRWDTGGISTAFVAEWGEGGPIVGVLGEYDALAGLSQKLQPEQEPIVDGAPGHGCGHNLLGTGGVATAVAVRHWLEESGTSGTIRYYGCPAEEQLSGKTFMARDGAFDDLDAALMTETSYTRTFRGACSNVLNNHVLADAQYENLKAIGPIEFTQEEVDYAARVNSAFPEEDARAVFDSFRIPPEWRERVDGVRGAPLIGGNYPAWDEDHIGTGSTDVGDVSWIAPLSMLRTACFATAAPGHSWAIVATAGMSIGHKGMMHAAKTMAATAYDLYTKPDLLAEARAAHASATKRSPYRCPIPDEVSAPRVANPVETANSAESTLV